MRFTRKKCLPSVFCDGRSDSCVNLRLNVELTFEAILEILNINVLACIFSFYIENNLFSIYGFYSKVQHY